MKLYKYSLALILGFSTLVSCSDKMDLLNPNQQTSSTFGFNADDLEESVIAAYNHIRMEGSYARVGYTIDVCRGDEAWNSSQVWYMPFDDLNAEVTSDITWWPWREWYYTINVCNFAISRCGEDNSQLSNKMKRIKGQVLFLRGLSYYNLVGYYQNPPLITDYATYSSLDGLYTSNSTYDAVLDQVEKDFHEAMELLPSRDEGGEWAGGRATCGAAAGYYARALMMRQKYSDALTVLKDIIGKKYGTYRLMLNYGDNFREGSAYENNAESLFEVQYLDYGSQGTDDEWTPVNTSPNATQGSAIESNFGPGNYGGWADISASPWLYQLFKSERTITRPKTLLDHRNLRKRLGEFRVWQCSLYAQTYSHRQYGDQQHLRWSADRQIHESPYRSVQHHRYRLARWYQPAPDALFRCAAPRCRVRE